MEKMSAKVAPPEMLRIGLPVPDKFTWTFVHNGKDVGKLTVTPDGLMEFEGNADQSAQIFLDLFIQHFEDWFRRWTDANT